MPLLLLACFTLADPVSPHVSVHAQQKVCTAGTCRIQRQVGGGTIIGRHRGRYAVLTCYHVVIRRGAHEVESAAGRFLAELIAGEPADDLAVVVFASPTPHASLPLAESLPAPRDAVIRARVPGAQPYPSALVAGYSGERRDILFRATVQSGDSGSALIHDDCLVGVIWGVDPERNLSYAVNADRIAQFLARRQVRLDPPADPPDAPPPASSTTPPVGDRACLRRPALCPGLVPLQRDVFQLRQHVERLSRPSLPAAGPPGPPGPPGPTGAPGPPGPAAELAPLRRELRDLRNRVEQFETTFIVEVTPLP